MSDKPKYTLIYWPIAGRGEFVRLCLEYAQVAYDEITEVEEIKKLGFGGGGADASTNAVDKDGFPFFAVPALQNHETGLMIAQSGVICWQLGQELKLMPSRTEDNARAEQVNHTITDFCTEGSASFYGIQPYGSYEDQKEETQRFVSFFGQSRLPRFLNHFNALLKWSKGKGWPFTFGSRICYVDLRLLHVLRVAETSVPEAFGEAMEKFPELKEFKKRMEEEPVLKAYWASDRCRPYWAHSFM